MEEGGLYFFSHPIHFEPPSAPRSKIYSYSTPYCTSMTAYGVTCYYSFLLFIVTIKPTYQQPNFSNFVTKVNKTARTARFPRNFEYKAFELYYDVTVKFSPIKKKLLRKYCNSETIKYQIRISYSISQEY